MKQIIFTTVLLLASCFAAVAQVIENPCPTISITNYIFSFNEKPVTFTAEISNEIDKYNVEYKWKVKDGQIVKGQGTRVLKFLPYEKYREIDTIATLNIRGLPETCENSISETYHVKIVRSKPIKFWDIIFLDEYEDVSMNGEEARLDIFLMTLQEDRTAEGFIRLQVDSRGNLYRRLRQIDNYLLSRKFKKTRISFAIVKSEKKQTQFWAGPQRARLPNCAKCTIVRAEESRQTLGKLFPTKSKIQKRKK